MAGSKTTAPPPAPPAPQPPRTSAIIDLDFSDVMEADSLAAETTRRSKWNDQLDALYQATIEDKVPRDEAGELKFTRLGHFTNVNGARTQVKVFLDKGLDKTYDFRSVTTGKTDAEPNGGSNLWARVKEVEEGAATDDTATE